MVGIIITGVIVLGALLITIVSISIYCHRKLRFVYACIIVANCMRIVFNMFMYRDKTICFISPMHASLQHFFHNDYFARNLLTIYRISSSTACVSV